MRPDMGKCVIERPRRGSSMPSVKARTWGRFVIRDGELDYEGLTRLPVSQKGAKLMFRDCKDFSDVLGPLENYLRSSCGRPWNDVYSEISRVIGRGAGWGVQHILTAHLNVATCTWRGVSGKVYYHDKHGVDSVGDYRSEFYVEPETGILRESPPRYRLVPVKPPEPITVIPVTEGKEYRKIAGIWYYREYEMQIIQAGPKLCQKAEVLVWETKRQLGKKQLRDLKLKN